MRRIYKGAFSALNLSDNLLSYLETDRQHETGIDSCRNDHLECFH